MSAHLGDVERWHEEAVQLCLASSEHTSGVGHHRADVYGPCATHLDAAKYVAARVAAAVAAERDRWDTEHAARTAEHIDLHAVKQIIDVTGCDGEQGVTAWSALMPLVGHIEREAIVKAREARDQAWREALSTCPCGCDVSLHYNVCSTADCDCDRNEYNARYVAAEVALIAEARS